MKRSVSRWLFLGTLLLFHLPASAQIEMPRSVVGSGGGRMSDENYVLRNTVGQAVIGVMSGPSYSTQIGFWYPGSIITGVEEPESVLPADYWLGQNYPNPFNPVTTLQFSVPMHSRVSINLYDVAGRVVRILVDEELDPGRHNTVLDAEGLSSGVYFCRMVAGGFVETRKIVLLK